MIYIFQKVFRKIFPPSIKEIEQCLIEYKKTNIYQEVLTVNETIDIVIKNKMSLSRFGDGEFSLCFGKNIKFQEKDKKLKLKLQQILKNKRSSNCLISIPEFRATNHTEYWKKFWFENIEKISTLLNKNYKYGNAGVTREIDVQQLMAFTKIWENKIGIFVVGKDSHFDFIPELFSNLKEHYFIYASSKNAWMNYNEILKEIFNKYNFDDCIFLISLGPTATVLAYELAEKGKQAIDIGHISNIYNYLVHQEKIPENLPDKKVN